MSRKHPLLVELERDLRVLEVERRKEWLMKPLDVWRYLGVLGYGKEYARKLRYWDGCPKAPCAKVAVEMWVRRRRMPRVTPLQREALRLRRMGVGSYDAAERLGKFPGNIRRAAIRAAEIEKTVGPVC